MSMTRFHIRLPGKVLVYIPQLLLLSLLISCSPVSPAHDDGDARIKVESARYTGNPGDQIETACGEWSLTPEQVRAFFELSSRYEEYPYSEFYQVPCTISGEISAEGHVWRFEINGGGTATWSSDSQARYWGCSAEQCEPLVLLLSDGMSGD